ncbi:MAG: hypothetical protein CSYNP_02649 [Syntrophus sp. SKADARSKE-3]|nr:hypothetical protein [Syntrophus sp. SKADARSKE-3]
MQDQSGINQKLMKENALLKQRIKRMEQSEAGHRQTARDLKTTLERFQIILSSFYAGVIVVNEDNQIEFVNQSFCDLFDLDESPADLRGLSPTEIIRKIIGMYADPPHINARIQEVVAGGQPLRGEEVGIKGDRTYMLDFIPIWIAGKRYGRIWHHQNITERKQAEKALRCSEGRLHTLVHTIPDLIWLKDVDGIYLSCNRIFERLFGAREEDIVGKTDYDFVDRELADFFRENDRKAMAAGKPMSNEEWITFADGGNHVLLETIKTPMFDADGTLIGVLGIGRDITERKRSEKELAAKTCQLEEANVALRVLLQRMKEEQQEIENTILANIQKLVLPYLEKLDSFKLNNDQANCLNMATTNLHQIVSPFLKNLNACFANFTRMEIQVANMIKEGKTSKEIAQMLNCSIRSIDFHRDNIRKKLGLNKKKTNLHSYLIKLI